MRGVVWIFAACALLLTSAPAEAAPTHDERLRNAQRELRSAPRAQRFDIAAQRCRAAIAAKQEFDSAAWCVTATREAVDARRRERREFSAAEIDFMMDAAWFVAVRGVQQDAVRHARPPLADLGVTDPLMLQRLYAYQFLGDARCNCPPTLSLPVLLFSLGVNLREAANVEAARTRAFDAALAAPASAERLWALTALALSIDLEIPEMRTLERLRREGAATAARLAPLLEEAQGFTGRDAVLGPYFRYAYGHALRRAGDYDAALSALDESLAACTQHLWQTADLCIDIAFAAVETRSHLDDVAHYPELVDAPHPAVQRRNALIYDAPETVCAAFIVGDIDAAGAFTNMRIAFQTDNCEGFIREYAAGFGFAPESAAPAGQRRRNVGVKLQFYPQ